MIPRSDTEQPDASGGEFASSPIDQEDAENTQNGRHSNCRGTAPDNSSAGVKHERGRLYDRLKAADQLEPAPGGAAEWNDWKSILIPIGMFAFAIGLLLAVAIYVSILGRFF